MFDAIDFNHFVLPVLHILLGLVNDIYKNLLAELQAGYEVYTDAFVELESEWTITAANHWDAKDEKAEHDRLYGNSTKYLKVSCFLALNSDPTVASIRPIILYARRSPRSIPPNGT
jgi:hypothetical protein